MPIALLAASVAALAGCATGSQARTVKPSGFLGENRALLQPGNTGDDELLVYRKPETNFAAYTKLQLEPVTIWSDPDRKLTADERRDLQKLVNSFQETLRRKLSVDYELVDRPASDVMRLEVAITNSRRSDTTLKLASKAVPWSSVGSLLWTFITGKPPFVGEASIETMIKDSSSGELLWAGVDRRVGADTIIGTDSINTEYFNSWGDVKHSLDYWSDGAVYRLCSLRDGSNCLKPKKGLKLPG